MVKPTAMAPIALIHSMTVLVARINSAVVEHILPQVSGQNLQMNDRKKLFIRVRINPIINISYPISYKRYVDFIDIRPNNKRFNNNELKQIEQ